MYGVVHVSGTRYVADQPSEVVTGLPTEHGRPVTAASRPSAPKPRVLVVDDLAANLLALEVLVQDLGYEAILANSGSEALKRLLESEFDCVLLDLQMPGINGLETAALIRGRERHRHVPLLFITSGEPTLDERSRGYSLGAVDFVVRPLNSDILKSKIRTVTELYAQRETARRENDEGWRERLDRIFAQMPMALWSTDESLIVTFCGGSYYGTDDVPPPEVFMGKRLSALLPSVEGAEHPAVAAHRRALQGVAVTYVEQRKGRTFEASLRPYRDPLGNIKGVIGTAIDISDKRRSEEALREGEERFALMVRGIKEYAIIFLSPEGRVEEWNPGAERIKGYSAAEAVGMHYARFFTPEDQVAGGKAGRLLIEAAQQGAVQDQGWCVRKDGSKFWADIVIASLRRPDGSLRGYAQITRDLTDRHEAEVKLRQLNENLEQQVVERTAGLQRTVEELQAFNHSLAHDLRAPLRAMIGMSQLLFEEYQGKVLDSGGLDYVKRIMAAGRQMDLMTSGLLAYARVSQDHLDLKDVELASILKETLADMAEDIAVRKALIQTERLPELVRAHPLLLKLVLTNLLYNAIKFMPPGVQPRVRISAEKQGRFIRIRVEDNGIGIAPEQHGKIFKIFERLHTQQEFPGTGIGLAIVKRAVERMAGRVGLESQLGQGSRFWIELPAA